MTRLILWRHGRTEWNLVGRFQGQLDVELDDVGVTQAEEAAHRVAAYSPDLIVASDLRRASRTAQCLGALLDREVSLDARLRERSFGTWDDSPGPRSSRSFPTTRNAGNATRRSSSRPSSRFPT